MAEKLLVTIHNAEETERVRATGAEVLAEYPDALLVRATDAQEHDLENAGMDASRLQAEPPVQTATARFAFSDAVAANAEVPIALEPHRTAYFIVQLAGPVAVGWMDTVEGHGATVRGTLPGYRLVVGMLPSAVEGLRGEPFVEEITPYRPAMKLSPRLRADVPDRVLSVSALANVDAGALAEPEPEQVEITVFAGESVEQVAAQVRAGGGVVLSAAGDTVVAQAPPEVLIALAGEQAVQAIQPHVFPEFTNDRATRLIGVPADRVVGGGTAPLSGAGEVIGVADSGLDTGDEATIHPDLRGRVTIVSMPNPWGEFATDPPPFDDGPADERAHGTHVAGSVAGSGSVAAKAGATTVPRGVAPEAHLYFQSIGQRVAWDLESFRLGQVPRPYGLWGRPRDLRDLFQPAYDAGARVHTNSWGSDDAGAYTTSARAVDDFMFTHRDILILFSAGNDGRDVNRDGQIDPDSIGSPGTAKNCVTVGASESDRPVGSAPAPGYNRSWVATWPDRFAEFESAGYLSDDPQGLALFSSRGPTDDGRVKPEVVAPGTNVLSLRSSVYDAAYVGLSGDQPLWGDVRAPDDPLRGQYCWSGGTSMATPLVAGVTALIRQHLVQHEGHHHDGVTPSGALLKAFIVNGAEPLTGQYPGEVPDAVPNNVMGFGRVNLTRSLPPPRLGGVRFSDDPALALVSGQTRTFRAQALGPSQPLSVTLAWTDPPSLAGVGGLQNTLYLQVVPPGGAPIDGDVTPYPTVTNNTQRVTVTAPVAGSYEIHVRAVNVAARSAGAGAPAGVVVQDFALVVSGARDFSAPAPDA